MSDWEPLEEDEVSEKLGVELDPDDMQAGVCRGHLRMERHDLCAEPRPVGRAEPLVPGTLRADIFVAGRTISLVDVRRLIEVARANEGIV